MKTTFKSDYKLAITVFYGSLKIGWKLMQFPFQIEKNSHFHVVWLHKIAFDKIQYSVWNGMCTWNLFSEHLQYFSWGGNWVKLEYHQFVHVSMIFANAPFTYTSRSVFEWCGIFAEIFHTNQSAKIEFNFEKLLRRKLFRHYKFGWRGLMFYLNDWFLLQLHCKEGNVLLLPYLRKKVELNITTEECM